MKKTTMARALFVAALAASLSACVTTASAPPRPRIYTELGEPAPEHTPPIVGDAGAITVTEPGF